MIQSIYLAGKISTDDWRYDVVSGLRQYQGGPWPQRLPKAVSGIDYVGPFFEHLDHCSGHGLEAAERSTLLTSCLNAIDRADAVFAWLDTCDPYGTLVEIGYAKARNKPIFVAFPHDVGEEFLEDLWFAAEASGRRLMASTATNALRRVIQVLKLESPIEKAFWIEHLRRNDMRLAGMEPAWEVLDGKYRLDFAIPQLGLAVELDGFEYHSEKAQFIKDRQRERELRRLGWDVIRFAGSEITADVEHCLDEVLARVEIIEAKADDDHEEDPESYSDGYDKGFEIGRRLGFEDGYQEARQSLDDGSPGNALGPAAVARLRLSQGNGLLQLPAAPA